MPSKPMTLRLPPALYEAVKAAAGTETISGYIIRTLSEATNTPYTPSSWGGDRLAARLKGVYISVANGVALVCKTVDGKTTPAANADELSDEAAQAVARQGGSVLMSGIYDCPAELAARAKW